MKKIIELFLIGTLILSPIYIYTQIPVLLRQAPQNEYQPCSNQIDYHGSRGFAYSGSTTFRLNKQSMGSTTLTPIGSNITLGLPGATTVNNSTGMLYLVDQLSPYTLYSVDTTTGVLTNIVNLTGVPQSDLTGIAYDPTNSGQMWGISSNSTTSQIFSINTSTGECTPIGSPSTIVSGATSLSCSGTGTLFVICINTDALYKVNKTTGDFTLVGLLGINVNFIQDAQFDLSDNTLYWASFSIGNNAQLRILDTINASSTVVGAYSSSVSTIAIYGKFDGIDKTTYKDHIAVFPNPANKMVNIKAKNIETIKILNLAGQVQEKINVNKDNAEIDVSNYNAGLYYIIVKTDKGSFTNKITVIK